MIYVHIYLATEVLKARAVAKILTECQADNRHLPGLRQEKEVGKYTDVHPQVGL